MERFSGVGAAAPGPSFSTCPPLLPPVFLLYFLGGRQAASSTPSAKCLFDSQLALALRVGVFFFLIESCCLMDAVFSSMVVLCPAFPRLPYLVVCFDVSSVAAIFVFGDLCLSTETKEVPGGDR